MFSLEFSHRRMLRHLPQTRPEITMSTMLSQSPSLQRENAHQAVRLYHCESAEAVPLQSAGFLQPPEDPLPPTKTYLR